MATQAVVGTVELLIPLTVTFRTERAVVTVENEGILSEEMTSVFVKWMDNPRVVCQVVGGAGSPQWGGQLGFWEHCRRDRVPAFSLSQML